MPTFFIGLLIALPWLNPFSEGPSAAVQPWLFSAGCLALSLPWLTPGRVAQAAPAAWLIAALISAVFGLLQYFGLAPLFAPWINVTGLGEAFANLRQRNQFATHTNIGLAVVIYWSMTAAPRPSANAAGPATGPHGRLLLIPAAVLLALGNAVSSSRTGAVQLGLLLALAWLWRVSGGRRPASAPHTWWVFSAALLAYVVGMLVLPTLAGLGSSAGGALARISEPETGCGNRPTLWSNVWYLIMQKPWLGWGWGELDYAHFITLYPGLRFCDILDNAHNLPLQLAVELGLPLAALLIGLGLWLAWRAQPWRETDPTRQLAWMVLALILLHSMLEYPLWYGPFQVAFGLSVMLLCCRASAPDAALHLRQTGATRAPVVLALLMGASLVYAAWDYWRISQIYLAPTQRALAYREATLEKTRDSWLFRDQIRFAELTIAKVTPENAADIKHLATEVLHFSPEARVVEKLIESAALLGLEQDRQFYLARLQAAFPERYAQWIQKSTHHDSTHITPATATP